MKWGLEQRSLTHAASRGPWMRFDAIWYSWSSALEVPLSNLLHPSPNSQSPKSPYINWGPRGKSRQRLRSITIHKLPATKLAASYIASSSSFPLLFKQYTVGYFSSNCNTYSSCTLRCLNQGTHLKRKWDRIYSHFTDFRLAKASTKYIGLSVHVIARVDLKEDSTQIARVLNQIWTIGTFFFLFPSPAVYRSVSDTKTRFNERQRFKRACQTSLHRINTDRVSSYRKWSLWCFARATTVSFARFTFFAAALQTLSPWRLDGAPTSSAPL